jgi:putative FmdB family regulatory protein
MPTYDYICKKCSYEFEEFQSMKAEPLKSCPKCGGLVVRKIGSGAGLLFKGTGFYITDYKNNGNTDSKKKSSEKSVPKSKDKSNTPSSETKKAS